MMHTFSIRVEPKNLHDVAEIWELAEDIEKYTRLVIYWTITSSCPGLFWLEGKILD